MKSRDNKENQCVKVPSAHWKSKHKGIRTKKNLSAIGLNNSSKITNGLYKYDKQYTFFYKKPLYKQPITTQPKI